MIKATFVHLSCSKLFLGSLALAQDQGAPGCGDQKIKFEVKSDEGQFMANKFSFSTSQPRNRSRDGKN